MSRLTQIKVFLLSLTFCGSVALGCVEDGTDDLTGILESSLQNTSVASKILESLGDDEEEEEKDS